MNVNRQICGHDVVAMALGIVIAMCGTTCLAADGKIQPGQWRSTDTVIEMTNPLLSPEAVAQRKSKPLVVDYCVSSDDIVALVVGKDKGGACEGKVSVSGGRLSVDRSCNGGKTTRKIEGTYSATKIDTVRDATLQMPNGVVRTKTHVVSERIGDCK